MEKMEVQENDLRTYNSVSPYLKKPHEAILVLLNIPFQDGFTIWLTMYFNFVVNLHDFNLSIVLILPFKFFFGDLVNDALYYWLHTNLHKPQWYTQHKLHHLVKHPIAWCAGIMNWEEMLATFLITRIFTPIIIYYIFGPWKVPEFCVYNLYLGAFEISGHSGCIGGNILSTMRIGTDIFMLALGIQLEVGHHDLHHELSTVNFGKRCSLYDKIFGTYMDHKLKVPSYMGGSAMMKKKSK